ncbi:MAG: SEC-C metal-binding domain-containing protein [Thermodesulfobacteriota bacterium]|nr:SEC-C metal-binding domain-containing protein [Thermodesulfobacteriota bacterium]
MSDSNEMQFDTMSEEELNPILEFLQGGDPDVIALKAGITREQLLRMRDDLLAQAEQKRAELTDVPLKKIGRNEPCPCGSGKKYKHCCLEKHETAGKVKDTQQAENLRSKEKEQEQLIKQIEKAFGLLSSRKYAEAIQFALNLISNYPDEDRLHDIIATSHLYAGECEEAIEICWRRLEVARSEKAYFIEHGRYRDAEIDKPALSYYYPPLTWMQKYWIALKAKDYAVLYPETENPEIIALVKKLQTADDPNQFPEKHSNGLELRRNALKGTLDQLKAIEPEIIPYLLPLCCKYSWTGIFATEILSCYKTDLSNQALIDISMFGFAYASGASLHYLEQLGETVIPYIEEAFSRDKIFDPIKTGIVSVLGNIQVPASYELLLRLLEHESSHIVNWAGDALGQFNNVEALPAMIAANERIGGEKMIDSAIQKLKDMETEV